jgi:hypothetical protein
MVSLAVYSVGKVGMSAAETARAKRRTMTKVLIILNGDERDYWSVVRKEKKMK